MTARTIRALIVDDEPLARRGVRQLLAPHGDVTVIGEARNGREAVRALRSMAPDLVFLDIQMPEVDGFGVLREHGPHGIPALIFVTAYDDFAVRAFDAHALDYLVKPLEEARFNRAVDRARERIHSADAVDLARRLSALLAERDASQRLLVPTATGELVLDVDDVEWIEADDYYAAVHANGRRHLIRESLASLATRLDGSRFVRVHRSAIVNVARVKEFRSGDDGENVLLLRGGARVPVSRRRRESVSAALRGERRE